MGRGPEANATNRLRTESRSATMDSGGSWSKSNTIYGGVNCQYYTNSQNNSFHSPSPSMLLQRTIWLPPVRLATAVRHVLSSRPQPTRRVRKLTSEQSFDSIPISGISQGIHVPGSSQIWARSLALSQRPPGPGRMPAHYPCWPYWWAVGDVVADSMLNVLKSPCESNTEEIKKERSWRQSREKPRPSGRRTKVGCWCP